MAVPNFYPMKYFALTLSLIIGIIFSSCSPRVVTNQPNAANLDKYESFAYLPNADVEVNEEKFDRDRVNTQIVVTLNKEMRRLGYTLDREKPDLLVLISTTTNNRVDIDQEPVTASYPYTDYPYVSAVSPNYNDYYYNGYRKYPGIVGFETEVDAYTEGSVVITLVDRKSREVVWRGATDDALYNQSSVDRMIDLVENVFDEYPINAAR